MSVNPDFLRIYIPQTPMEDDSWSCNFCLENPTSLFIDPCGHGNCPDCLNNITKDPVYDPPVSEPQRTNEHGNSVPRDLVERGGTKKCTVCSAVIGQVGQVFYSIKNEKSETVLNCGVCHEPANLQTDEKGPPVISKRCNQPRENFDQSRKVGHIFHKQCFQAKLDRQPAHQLKTCVVCLSSEELPQDAFSFSHIEEFEPIYPGDNPPPDDNRLCFLNEIDIAISTVGYLILIVGFLTNNSTTCFGGGGIMGAGLAGLALSEGYYGGAICALTASAVSVGLVLQVSTTALVSLSVVGAVALAAEVAYWLA